MDQIALNVDNLLRTTTKFAGEGGRANRAVPEREKAQFWFCSFSSFSRQSGAIERGREKRGKPFPFESLKEEEAAASMV